MTHEVSIERGLADQVEHDVVVLVVVSQRIEQLSGRHIIVATRKFYGKVK
jgi:hypothetical protein